MANEAVEDWVARVEKVIDDAPDPKTATKREYLRGLKDIADHLDSIIDCVEDEVEADDEDENDADDEVEDP